MGVWFEVFLDEILEYYIMWYRLNGVYLVFILGVGVGFWLNIVLKFYFLNIKYSFYYFVLMLKNYKRGGCYLLLLLGF